MEKPFTVPWGYSGGLIHWYCWDPSSHQGNGSTLLVPQKKTRPAGHTMVTNFQSWQKGANHISYMTSTAIDLRLIGGTIIFWGLWGPNTKEYLGRSPQKRAHNMRQMVSRKYSNYDAQDKWNLKMSNVSLRNMDWDECCCWKTIFGKVDGSILRNTWETEKTQLYGFFCGYWKVLYEWVNTSHPPKVFLIPPIETLSNLVLECIGSLH